MATQGLFSNIASMMDKQQQPASPPSPREYILDAFVDPTSVRDVVQGILHTIFFHRFYPCLAPKHRDVLDVQLPYVDDAEVDTMIVQRTAELARDLSAERSNPAGSGGRGSIAVEFFEKKRRKGSYLRGPSEEEVCWERWTVKVTVAEPRTDSERAKVRDAMEQTLQSAVTKIMTVANEDQDHIPPITTTEANPFPYQIIVGQKNPSYSARRGLRVSSSLSSSLSARTDCTKCLIYYMALYRPIGCGTEFKV